MGNPVVRIFSIPHTEPIMVLRRNHYIAHPRFSSCRCPVFGVEARWVEGSLQCLIRLDIIRVVLAIPWLSRRICSPDKGVGFGLGRGSSDAQADSRLRPRIAVILNMALRFL